MIGEFTQIMDKFGTNKDFKPEIIRGAYLRAVKKQIPRMLKELRENPDSSEMRGWVSNMLEEAQNIWHFTPTELGIPAEVLKKLEL